MDEHGYPEAVVDGFTIGMFVSYGDCGDAYVKAPDGSMGTLIWEAAGYLRALLPELRQRWEAWRDLRGR